MSDVTATGIFKQPDMLATLLSESTTWQSLCDVSSAVHAKKFILVPMLDNSLNEDDDTTKYPRSIISWQDADNFSRSKFGTQGWTTTGTMTMTFEVVIPPDYPPLGRNAHTWFMNKAGAVINEMEQLAGRGEPISGETHINATGFTRIDGPWVEPADEVEILDPDMYEPKHIMWIVWRVEYI